MDSYFLKIKIFYVFLLYSSIFFVYLSVENVK